MRVVIAWMMLLVAITATGQVYIEDLEFAPDSAYVIASIDSTGEAHWVHIDSITAAGIDTFYNVGDTLLYIIDTRGQAYAAPLPFEYLDDQPDSTSFVYIKHGRFTQRVVFESVPYLIEGPPGEIGPQGPPGVSIDSIIYTPGDTMMILVKTDGSADTIQALAGPQGPPGPPGASITSMVYDSTTGTISFTLADSSTYTTPAVQGPPGQPGISVVNILYNEVDSTIEFIMSDSTGYALTALRGPVGPQGEKGDGITDIAFAAGDSVLTITLADGSTFTVDAIAGPTGPQGIQGVAGPTGPAGPTGEKGEKGDGITDIAFTTGDSVLTITLGDGSTVTVDAIAGPQGPQGIQGVAGPAGPAGPQGIQGVAGPTGPAGPTGEKGEKGDPGESITTMVYDSTTGTITYTYADSSTYTTPAVQGPPGPQGDKGDPGTGITEVSYALGDSVIRITLADSTTYTINAIAGPAGPAGQPGAPGPRGPSVTAMTYDSLNATITFEFDDGSTYVTPAVRGPRGEQGQQGQQGLTGIGIASVTFNAIDTTIIYTLTDGTRDTVAAIAGPQGIQGPSGPQGIQGPSGNGIDQIYYNNTDTTIIYVYTDGTRDTVPAIAGPQGPSGEKGDKGDPGSFTTGRMYLDTLNSELYQIIYWEDSIISTVTVQYDAVDCTGPAGSDGRSIDTIIYSEIDTSLYIQYSDGSRDTVRAVAGPAGAIGVGIDSLFYNDTDTTIIYTLTNGNSYALPALVGPAGADGLDGRGIDTIIYDSLAGTIVITLDDSTSYTMPAIAGPQGDKGDPGSFTTGRMYLDTLNSELYQIVYWEDSIISTVTVQYDAVDCTGPAGAAVDTVIYDTLNKTLRFELTDESFFVVPAIVGPQGQQGIQGPSGTDGTDGRGIDTIIYSAIDSTIVITLDDSTSYSMPAIAGPVGPQGQQGDPGSFSTGIMYLDTLNDSLTQIVYWEDSIISTVTIQYEALDCEGPPGVGIDTIIYDSTAQLITYIRTDGRRDTFPAIQGPRGMQGDPGSFSTGIMYLDTLNDSLTQIVYWEDSIISTVTIQYEALDCEGPPGRGIDTIRYDSTMGVLIYDYSDLSSDTLPAVLGPQGPPGSFTTGRMFLDTINDSLTQIVYWEDSIISTVTVQYEALDCEGPPGRGIDSLIYDSIAQILIYAYSDATRDTFPALTGEQGPPGPQGSFTTGTMYLDTINDTLQQIVYWEDSIISRVTFKFEQTCPDESFYSIDPCLSPNAYIYTGHTESSAGPLEDSTAWGFMSSAMAQDGYPTVGAGGIIGASCQCEIGNPVVQFVINGQYVGNTFGESTGLSYTQLGSINFAAGDVIQVYTKQAQGAAHCWLSYRIKELPPCGN